MDYELQTKVKALLVTLAADLAVATTDDVAEYLEGTYSEALGFAKVRRLLRDIGVPTGTRKGVSVWRLGDWLEARSANTEELIQPDDVNDEDKPGVILDFDELDD